MCLTSTRAYSSFSCDLCLYFKVVLLQDWQQPILPAQTKPQVVAAGISPTVDVLGRLPRSLSMRDGEIRQCIYGAANVLDAHAHLSPCTPY